MESKFLGDTKALVHAVLRKAQLQQQAPGQVAIVIDTHRRANHLRKEVFDQLDAMGEGTCGFEGDTLTRFTAFGTKFFIVPIGTAVAGMQYDMVVIESMPAPAQEGQPLSRACEWLHEVMACRLKPNAWVLRNS